MLDLNILKHDTLNTPEEFIANILELNTLKQLKDFYPYLIYCNNTGILNAYLYRIKKLKGCV